MSGGAHAHDRMTLQKLLMPHSSVTFSRGTRETKYPLLDAGSRFPRDMFDVGTLHVESGRGGTYPTIPVPTSNVEESGESKK